MTQVKVLVKGKHQAKGDRLIIGATTSLIKTDKNIIVDPGYFVDESKLKKALAKEKLKPTDIDIVVLTHLHLDHIINLHLFKNSLVYCKFKSGYPGQHHSLLKGYLKRINIKDGLKLAKNVEFLLTPGHTNDHISLLVKTIKSKYDLPDLTTTWYL